MASGIWSTRSIYSDEINAKDENINTVYFAQEMVGTSI